MMKMAVGQTEELDGEFAAAEILEQCSAALDGLEPQAGLLMASHDLDHEDFLAAVANAYPDLDLIGCTTLAPMSSAGDYAEGSTTLTLFASDVLDFTTGLGTNAVANIDAASRQAVEEAAAKTDKDPALLVVTPTIEHLDPTALTAQMGEVLGLTVPVFGGGASPDFPMTAPWLGGTQFSGQQVLTDSLPVLLISGPLKVSVGVAHGWGPVGKTAIVTKADEGAVYELDGEPVLDFYHHYLGIENEFSAANPLRILDEATGRYYLRASMSYETSDGSVTFLGSIPEGATVQLTMATTDDILGGTDSSVADAVASFPEDSVIEGVLVASCAVRNVLLGSRAGGELERITSAVGQGVPVAGFYAFGEIAPLAVDTGPRFHNGTCVTVLMGT